MNEDRMRELFREMQHEPVPADSLARVRMRVADRTRTRRFFLPLAVMLTAAACLIVAVFSARRPLPVAPPVVALSIAPPVIAPGPVARSVESLAPETSLVPAGRTPALHQRQVPRPRPSQHDVLIRIETPDPDVVLYFIADGSAD